MDGLCILGTVDPEVGLLWFLVFNTTFSYIVAISFIGGGNWSAQ
jgi:hypothetical protein